MSERDDFGAFLTGFLIGGIAGAVVALLYTPQSGEETRTMIKEKAIELKDKTSGTVEEVLSKAENAAKEAKKHAAEVIEKGQVILEKQKGKISKPQKTSDI
ncbi:MAG TPA: YtxH domain-containing protein [Anaerolineae bacterium]|nr:YtxH domain-containing protein [Anaerolineae bacterium]